MDELYHLEMGTTATHGMFQMDFLEFILKTVTWVPARSEDNRAE